MLAAGAYVSPKLLMLSGIGPAAELARHGIKTRVDLPGVGQNLQDHHEVPVIAYDHGKLRLLRRGQGLRMVAERPPVPRCSAPGRCRRTASRPAPSSIPRRAAPDSTVKIYCVAMIYLDRDVADVKPDHGVTLHLLPDAAEGARLGRGCARPTRPTCRSSTRNFLGHPDDLRIEIAALRFAREILATGR